MKRVTYKVLSLWQPWATLLVLGEKQVETRHWYLSHRGPLLIHAAKRFAVAEQELCMRWPFEDALCKHGYGIGNLPLGAIVGMVDVIECHRTEHVYFHGNTPQENFFGNFAPGRYGIVCRNPREFEKPIPMRGFQGLWNYEMEEAA